MSSTFGGIEMVKRGLSVHQTALNTVGHNISNADNPHYARQRVTLQSMEPIYEPSLNRAHAAGQLGQGVTIGQIERIRNSFYDDQISHAETVSNEWQARHNYLYQMERVINEPSDNSLRSLTDRFWASWQEMANHPSDLAHREVVLERGHALTTRVNDLYNKLTELRHQANREVITSVDEINGLAGQIRDLNIRILKSEAHGDSPNDLMDRRDKAVEELSKLANINIGRGDDDEVFVFIGEQALVQGQIFRPLATTIDSNNEGMARVHWEHNDRGVVLGGGKLKGLLEMRDRGITERIDQINLFAVNMADTVNEVHRSGFGLNGQTGRNFFDLPDLSANSLGNFQLQNSAGNVDLNQDGTPEITAIFRVAGVNSVDPSRPIGVNGTIEFSRNDAAHTAVAIDYSADDSLNDVVQRINDTRGGVVAYLNHESRLVIKGTTVEEGADRRTNFMIRSLADSGELLTGVTGVLAAPGEAGAFDYRRIDEIGRFRAPSNEIAITPNFHPASQLSVAAAVSQNPANIAAAQGSDIGGTGAPNTPNGPGDGSNALRIAAALKQESRMYGHNRNAEEFYVALVSKLGTQSRTAEDMVSHQKDNLVRLNDLRQSVMGVNLDEELANMIQFQQSYNASARVMQTMTDMIDTIINRLGA